MREVEIEVSVVISDDSGGWRRRVSKTISIGDVQVGDLNDLLTRVMAGMVPAMIHAGLRKYMRNLASAGDE